MKNRHLLKSNRDDMTIDPERTFIQFSGQAVTQSLPDVILNLRPAALDVRDDQVKIIFAGGFAHLWVTAYPDGKPGREHQNDRDRKLIDGLWMSER